jgi:succinylarginine dihydrolase
MQNGGGPACLRLRVALKDNELAAVNPGVILTPSLYDTLTAWVEKHYRDRLSESDLADPQLLTECRTALDELTQILKLGAVYPFQLN